MKIEKRGEHTNQRVKEKKKKEEKGKVSEKNIILFDIRINN